MDVFDFVHLSIDCHEQNPASPLYFAKNWSARVLNLLLLFFYRFSKQNARVPVDVCISPCDLL